MQVFWLLSLSFQIEDGGNETDTPNPFAEAEMLGTAVQLNGQKHRAVATAIVEAQLTLPPLA
jgi:hypothetical protein